MSVEIYYYTICIIDPAVNTFAAFAILQYNSQLYQKVDAQFQFFFQFKIKG